jgi:hypothetical protein
VLLWYKNSRVTWRAGYRLATAAGDKARLTTAKKSLEKRGHDVKTKVLDKGSPMPNTVFGALAKSLDRFAVRMKAASNRSTSEYRS